MNTVRINNVFKLILRRIRDVCRRNNNVKGFVFTAGECSSDQFCAGFGLCRGFGSKKNKQCHKSYCSLCVWHSFKSASLMLMLQKYLPAEEPSEA